MMKLDSWFHVHWGLSVLEDVQPDVNRLFRSLAEFAVRHAATALNSSTSHVNPSPAAEQVASQLASNAPRYHPATGPVEDAAGAVLSLSTVLEQHGRSFKNLSPHAPPPHPVTFFITLFTSLARVHLVVVLSHLPRTTRQPNTTSTSVYN
jgi:hypothetical protein